MALSPKLVGPAISSITGLITSTSMSFIGLALNYGFQPDFADALDAEWSADNALLIRLTCWYRMTDFDRMTPCAATMSSPD